MYEDEETNLIMESVFGNYGDRTTIHHNHILPKYVHDCNSFSSFLGLYMPNLSAYAHTAIAFFLSDHIHHVHTAQSQSDIERCHFSAVPLLAS